MNKKGFTLIELVMVIVILGILAAMVIPRFVDLQGRARFSATQGSLGALRAAVAIEYASRAAYGLSPAIPASLTGSMFQDGTIPREQASTSTATNTVTAVASPGGVTGTGGWAYDSVNGRAWVNHSAYTAW
jgi:prepilin-type N-terminal cleavage/methylation domain-containing protein